MGKGYPMWVKDTFEYITLSQSYRAKCHTHEMETSFHATAKRLFAATCRINPIYGATYNHSKVGVTAQKTDNEVTGGVLLTGY